MRKIAIAGMLLALTSCATWTSSNVTRTDGPKATVSSTTKQTTPESILITERDITDRRYKILGDIEVTVNKTTIFHGDPTQEKVNLELKEKAAQLGADAVIFVRYGTVGITGMSWGSLNGKGRAIKFQD